MQSCYRGEAPIWRTEAESVDVMSDNIRELEVFGFAYEYDVVANLRLLWIFTRKPSISLLSR